MRIVVTRKPGLARHGLGAFAANLTQRGDFLMELIFGIKQGDFANLEWAAMNIALAHQALGHGLLNTFHYWT